MTTALIVTPLVLALLTRVVAPYIADGLPPAVAVRLLTTLALVVSLAAGLALSVLGLFWVGQLAPVAAAGQWSPTFLHGAQPAPSALLTIGGSLALALILVGARQAARCLHAAWTAERHCRRLGGSSRLVVVDDETAEAYAVHGLRGRIVVSSAMLRALPADERRALLAHEGAHLTHRHDLYILLTRLAVAANPLLRPLLPKVLLGVERWADEVAAEDTGDRTLVARTLARAGLARAGSPSGSSYALGLTTTALAVRTTAMLQPPPDRSSWRTAGLGVAVLLVAVTGVALGIQTQHVFELAERAYQR